MEPKPSRREVLATAAALAGTRAASAEKPVAANSEETAARLQALLARNREKHPIYSGGLANHLSMELCALASLGATPDRLSAYFANYGRRLEPFPTGGPAVDRAGWREQIGRAEALPGLARFFAAAIRERGREDLLRDVLATFAPSMSSELFHCQIRTAYGVRFDDDDEVAHGLAYWAIKPMSLGPVAARTGRERDFAALLARVRETPTLASARLSGSSNPGRLEQASKLEGFAAVVDSLEVTDDTLDRIGRAVADLYASTRDFTALHAVTSTHALRVLLPYFPDRELALRYHAQALIAAYIRMNAPRVEAPPADAIPSWDAICARAVASEDDHDAKFTFSCREEESARGGAIYRQSAALRVGPA